MTQSGPQTQRYSLKTQRMFTLRQAQGDLEFFCQSRQSMIMKFCLKALMLLNLLLASGNSAAEIKKPLATYYSQEILVKIANVDQMIPRMMKRIRLLFFS